MRARPLLALVPLVLLLSADFALAGRRRPLNPPPEAVGRLTWASPQSNPIAASPDGSQVAVANTTSNSVSFINTAGNFVNSTVEVGMEPVGVAWKPDGSQIWVSNHVSDSVSVIDDLTKTVVETVQDVDANGVTQFDEPVGIAFKGDGSQAYVALSSRNDIAVIDTSTYAVTTRLHITAQDPRAIAVRGDRLYVAAFESSNQTEVSMCENFSDDPGPGQCTMNGADLGNFAVDPNLPGEIKNIVIDDDLPDRDLFVYDISGASPSFVESVDHVGTLQYGIAVDSNHRVYVSQADARNWVNGRVDGTAPDGDTNSDGDVNLEDLDNRMFENEISIVACNGGCGAPTQVDLEPGSPSHATALATPFGIGVTGDDSTVVATAAAVNRVFTTNSAGSVLSQLDVGAIPRGVALVDGAGGAPDLAYVLNTLDNTVTVVDVSDPTDLPTNNPAPTVIAVGSDPTPNAVRLGRIAFNSGFASDSGTFSCASCHPDGNTDQLLWRIGGACFFGGCVSGEDEPRTTMPIRGLRDTLPLHWDGTLGDPFGGGNGAVGFGGAGGTDCNLTTGTMHDCFVDLGEESLSGVMCDRTGSCPPGGNQLSAQEIDDMATFLESVSYPPARSRRLEDDLSSSAQQGFVNFFSDVGGLVGDPDTCADSTAGCHEFPFGAGTNSSTLGGFDVPTMRGMTDRFVQFSLGPTSAEEVLVASDTGITVSGLGGIPFPITGPPNQFPWNGGANGHEEDTTFGGAFGVFEPVYSRTNLFVLGPDLSVDIFQMFEEASTGHPGSLGRQVTLTASNTTGCPACDVEDTLIALELAAEDGLVNLRGTARFNGLPRTIAYHTPTDQYRLTPGNAKRTRAALVADVNNGGSGVTVATLTGHLRSGITEASPQPLLIPSGANCGSSGATGDPALPSGTSFTLETKYVTNADEVWVDGLVDATATISVSVGGAPGSCSDEVAEDTALITLGSSPGSGSHLLQVRTPGGLLSNEVPFVVP